MKRNIFLLIATVCLELIALETVSNPMSATAASLYTVTNIDSFSNNRFPDIDYLSSINNTGEVTGSVYKAGRSNAFLWNSETNSLQLLTGLPSSTSSDAKQINNFGQVIGSSSTNSTHAVLWNGDGAAIALGELPGDVKSFANSINNLGQIVGYSGKLSDGVDTHAILWNSSGLPQVLSTLPGTTYSEAFNINDSSQVVGMAVTSIANNTGRENRAVFWQSNGLPLALNNLPDTVSSIAESINNQGQIVGIVSTKSTGDHAVEWNDSNSLPLELGTLPGDSASRANKINNLGQIVGVSEQIIFFDQFAHPVTIIDRPFLYSNGKINDLNDLIPANSGWKLFTAEDINDNGQIIGEGTLNGQYQTYIATPRPVPEKSSILGLLVLGILGTAFNIMKGRKLC